MPICSFVIRHQIVIGLIFLNSIQFAYANEWSSDIRSYIAQTLARFRITQKRSESCTSSVIKNDSTIAQIQGVNGKTFSVSVLSEVDAKKIFNKLATQKHIAYKYTQDGCNPRAHEMARIMDNEGIVSGKMFAEGRLVVPGSPSATYFHVAPFILVNRNGKIQQMVLDPSVFKEPVSVDKWSKSLTQAKDTKLVTVYATKRFNYVPADKNLDLTEYRSKDLEITKEELEILIKVQNHGPFKRIR